MGSDSTLLLMAGQAEMRERLRWAERARRAEAAAAANASRSGPERLRRALRTLVTGGRVSLAVASATPNDAGRERP